MVKSFVIICIVSIALVCVLQTESFHVRRNNLVVGTLRPGNVLVLNQTVNAPGQFGQIITRNVTWNNGLRNITRVRALDQNALGTGGFAAIVSGGPGSRNVTVNLRSSAPGRPLNFTVDIYAL